MKYSMELELLEKSVKNIFKKAEEQEKKISYKKRNEVVTSSDLFIETEIIKTIKAKFPDDKFHSEEFNRDTLLGDRTWIIDPIDGTSNYALNLDTFVVQIALYDKDKIVLSYIYMPRTNKTFYSIVGEGAYLDGNKTNVFSDLSQPNQLMSLVGLSHNTKKDKTFFMKLIDYTKEENIKIRVFGTIGYEMALMAQGAFVMLYTDVKNLWDVAPGLLLVKEAGACVFNESGNEYSLGDEHMFIFCNEEFAKTVLKSLGIK